MRTLPPLAINGKFLAAPPTGVHRVAAELANALARIAAARPDMLDVELWVPRNVEAPDQQIALPVRRIAPFTGIPWEQLATPLRHRRRLLLNLCNIGPVLRGNAVTMIHDAQVHLTPDSYRRPFRLWYKTVQPLIGRRHRALLTVSHYSRTEIARAGICPAERIAVVPNGVDHIARVASEPEVIDRLGLTGRPYVIATASTQAHKNVALLAKAFHDPALADIRLVLVGDGSAHDFAEAGIILPPQAQFTGRVSDSALRALYEGALCIAFPSRTEGFGLPPMEAMLLGCPAIVAPCGALPEVCADAALYADPDDPAEWSRLIRAFAGDTALRDHHATLGRERAARFTWEASAWQLIEALSALAENAPLAEIENRSFASQP
jgi:glycosyltransferase involved in cell wall biosynthesis